MSECAFTHPGTAVFVRNRSDFLLCRRAQGRAGAGLWSLPGGRLERHEKWRTCGMREVQEETGLIINTPRFITMSTTTEDQGWLTIWMSAATSQRYVTPNEEVAEWCWVNLADMRDGEFPLWQAHWAPLLEDCGGWSQLSLLLAAHL